jgi:hypothetical protein
VTHCQHINDYEVKLREEQAQLATERGRLAHYEGLLNLFSSYYLLDVVDSRSIYVNVENAFNRYCHNAQ